MESLQKPNWAYTIVMQPPPGNVVAPNGFPANPRPQGVPSVFLDAMEVRIKVFCDEQNCALEPELDEDDPRSWHWVLYQSPVGDKSSMPEPVSVLRVVPPPHGTHPNGFYDPDEEPYCKIGRVATMKHARKKGLSRKLIEQALAWMSKNSTVVGRGWKGNVLVHAQVEVEPVYSRLGFEADERLGRWDEEGIEHLGMWQRVRVQA